MIYYDFHIHSALSPCGDNDMTPANIVGMAKISNLDAVAISDHNSIANIPAAMRVGEAYGVKVVPGMEVETEEEVHILTLYPSFDAAESVWRMVYDNMPNVLNKSEIFGEQRILDEDDNIIGYEDRLLLSPSAISIEHLFYAVKDVGGLFIPAHVDRHSYSVLTNLGFMPTNIPIEYIELSRRVDIVEDYIESRKELSPYKVMRNSDAHYLVDIAQRDSYLDISSIEELFKA